LKSEGEDN